MPWNRNDDPPDWEAIRDRILQRDNHCCKFCAAPNHALICRPFKGDSYWKLLPEGMAAEALYIAGVRATKIVLTIAHLDHDKDNWDVDDSRLAALCQRCHLGYDLPRHINNRKYGRNHAAKHQTKLF